MLPFLIHSVDAAAVTLCSHDGAFITLPASCFEQSPVVGKEIRLIAVPATIDQPLPHPLARSLLNELLTHSTP